MGALNERQFNVEIGRGLKLDSVELGLEEEQNTLEIQNAVRVLLQGLNEDITREGLKKTPLRVAKALLHGTKGYKQKANDIVHSALFPEAGLDKAVGHAGGEGGFVTVRDIDLFSICESCLLPFQIKCHVGYVSSDETVVGLSKLSRVADVFARRMQHPQRLADEICTALQQGIKPAGVAIVLQCLHIHFPNLESLVIDSSHQGWVKAMVRSGSGVFENENADCWSDFLHLLRGVDVDKILIKDTTEQCWCPSQSPLSEKLSSKAGPPNPAMVTAVASILRSLGEDPLRKELTGTPNRFVKWLMNFQNTKVHNGCGCGNRDAFESNGGISHNKEQMYTELNLTFWSQCEHHLLPFYGVVHIGYLCANGFKPIERDVVHSIVHSYGFKLQVQERLTRQIAETVGPYVGGDVMVVVEADHTCMISRGIEKFRSNTATFANLGRFSTDSATRASFLKSIPKRNVS